MSVEAEKLTKYFGEQAAVFEAQFQIQKGEVVGLLGPNGAGKSTLLKMLTCFTSPTYGSARVCGNDLLKNSLQIRKCIGYLPEDNPLYPEMYVKEYLSFISGLYNIGKGAQSRINKMIRLTGLEPEQHKTIRTLSKGYRQRVGLAQALVHSPEVLILDEPTSGLDPNQVIEIRKLIREAGAEKTVILSSHILQEVQAICDRVIIIHKGQIIADDQTERLLKRFSGQVLLQAMFKNPIVPEELRKVDGVEAIEQKGHHWVIMANSKRDIREDIFRFAVEKQNPLLELVQKEENLENVFQQLTRNQQV